jgi:hypothetical protein
MAVTMIEGPEPVDGRWEVTFGDTRRPSWTVTFVLVDQGPRYACVGVRYDGSDDLSTTWMGRFPTNRCLKDARLALEQLLVVREDPRRVQALPFGYPNKANRGPWYRALLETVDRWEQLGMSPMDAYREVARRKRVDVNRVKQWMHVGRKLEKERK